MSIRNYNSSCFKWFQLLNLGFLVSVTLLFSASAFAQVESEKESEKISTYEKLKVFSEILSLLESSYVEPVDPDNLINGAIRGMLKSLDPHTTFLTPDSYKEMKVETSGKFGGLGIEISMRDGMLTVVSPIEDTPADRAGILAKDKIIQIEGESTLDMTLAEAVSKLRGKPGSPINMTIFREGLPKPKEVTLVRDIIKVRSVKYKVFNKEIGYIKVRSFSKTTSHDLDNALSKLGEASITRLILDLRNNPGGLLNQAVEVADRFLDGENLIVYTSGRTDEQNMRFTTHDKVQKVSYPMIIMVNGGSASASEIVSGALQDLGRAVVLGTPTFGKGSVQTIIPLSDGSALRLTTARYYTPSGRVIQENGIEPDILMEQPVVSLKENKKEEEKKDSPKKARIRKFLREKDLKKHLKGRKDIEEGTEEVLKEESKEKEKISLDEDLRKDYQLQQAVSLLSGWEIMKQFYRPKISTARVQ